VSGYLYDTGALIAAERGDRVMWALHRRILSQGIRPTVPSTVLAQAWRGGPQAQLSRLLAGCAVREFTEEHARSAGRLLEKAGGSDIVDASVVVMAQQRAEEVLTNDPDDMRPLVAAVGRPRVAVRPLNDLDSRRAETPSGRRARGPK
jgi:predicted nucleic acid-binding protein